MRTILLIISTFAALGELTHKNKFVLDVDNDHNYDYIVEVGGANEKEPKTSPVEDRTGDYTEIQHGGEYSEEDGETENDEKRNSLNAIFG